MFYDIESGTYIIPSDFDDDDISDKSDYFLFF